MIYTDPFFLHYAYADQNTPPSTFGQYVSGNDAAPANPNWMTATMDCDVTIHNPALIRQGVEEGAQIPTQFLIDAGALIGKSEPPPAADILDIVLLNANGLKLTLKQAWTPW